MTVLIEYLLSAVLLATGFVKKGLPHTTYLPTLKINNLKLEKAIDLTFGRW